MQKELIDVLIVLIIRQNKLNSKNHSPNHLNIGYRSMKFPVLIDSDYFQNILDSIDSGDCHFIISKHNHSEIFHHTIFSSLVNANPAELCEERLSSFKGGGSEEEKLDKLEFESSFLMLDESCQDRSVIINAVCELKLVACEPRLLSGDCPINCSFIFSSSVGSNVASLGDVISLFKRCLTQCDVSLASLSSSQHLSIVSTIQFIPCGKIRMK